MPEGVLLRMVYPWMPSLLAQGLWTPFPLYLLSRTPRPKTLSSPACLYRYSPYTRRKTLVIEFSGFKSSVLFGMLIVIKKKGWPEVVIEWVTIVLPAVVSNETHRSGCMKRTPLSKRGKAVKLERQIIGGFSGCGIPQIIFYSTRITK